MTKVAYWYPDLDFDAALESLPEDTDLAPLRERIKPIINGVGGILRVEGQRPDYVPHFFLLLQVHNQDNCYL